MDGDDIRKQKPTPEEPVAVRARVLGRLVADQENGTLLRRADYEAEFPGFESIVREEFARLTRSGESTTREVRQALRSLLRTSDADLRRNPELSQLLQTLVGTLSRSDIESREPAVAEAVNLEGGFGDYDLLEEIGRGGMGVVYRAHHTVLDRIVALKMIRPDRSSTGAELDRFLREARTAARLDHPGIVPVHEVGVHDGVHFIAMAYVDGQSLDRVLRQGPIPSRRAAEIVRDLAQAVHYAHQQGIVHRDLKPANVIMDVDGWGRVTDFGLAKRLDDDADALTMTGDVLGTPSYMAPEQAAGSVGQVTPATDIYGLGALLYALLSGRPPFVGSSTWDVLARVIEETPLPLRDLDPRIDADLDLITRKCIQKPVDLRYRTADDLAKDLTAWLEDGTISARATRWQDLFSRALGVTRHAQILEYWGGLWIGHGVFLLVMGAGTNALLHLGYQTRGALFSGLALLVMIWLAVFVRLRGRAGPITATDRKIAHIWAADIVGMGAVLTVEWMRGMPAFELAPLFAVLGGCVFLCKAGMLSGEFYVTAAALFLAAILMVWFPAVALLIFGLVSCVAFVLPGLRYTRLAARSRDPSNDLSTFVEFDE